jgi:hypothetical protein
VRQSAFHPVAAFTAALGPIVTICPLAGAASTTAAPGGGLDDHAIAATPAQCSPKPPRSCTDMYEGCEDKKGRCTREIDEGKTLCAFCLDDCRSGRPYKYRECYGCSSHRDALRRCFRAPWRWNEPTPTLPLRRWWGEEGPDRDGHGGAPRAAPATREFTTETRRAQRLHGAVNFG